jgi:hypothetical protein
MEVPTNAFRFNHEYITKYVSRSDAQAWDGGPTGNMYTSYPLYPQENNRSSQLINALPSELAV